MPSVYKRKEDKKDRYAPWRFSYKDADGKRAYGTGYRDKELTRKLACDLEDKARERRHDPRKARQAESITDPIGRHLEDFKRHLQAKGDTAKHVRLTLTRVKAVVSGCRFASIGAMVRSQAAAWVADQIGPRRQAGTKEPVRIGPRTANHYAQVLEEFGRWLVEDDRLQVNPFTGLPRWNTEIDVRHARRALTIDELDRFLEATRENKPVQCFSGEDRYRIYRIAITTGLRKSEIASLTLGSFNLDGDPPTLTIDAACSKHRRQDVLPIHPGLAAELPGWITGLAPGDRLFPGLERKKTFRMVQKDLEAAGIPYEVDGEFMDFHGLRHSFVTNLLRAGASIVEVRDLARHSDIRMTARYVQLSLEDQAAALAKLPAQHGRNTACGSGCQPVYKAVVGCQEEVPGQKAHNPRKSKGYGDGRPKLSVVGGSCQEWRRRESNPTLISPKQFHPNDLKQAG